MTLVAVVFHLIDGSLAQGEIAGWIESTATGERTPIRDRDELIAVLVSLAIRRPTGLLAPTGDPGAPDNPLDAQRGAG